MHRLNLTIDDSLYEVAKELSSREKKSLSDLVIESLEEYISKHSSKGEESRLILDSEDEREVLNILNSDSFIDNDEFKKRFNL